VSLGFTTHSTVRGIGNAIVQAAELRAKLIPLDRHTRQFPLVYLEKGKFLLANPNVDGTLLLDTRNAPDREMIMAMGATQYAGALAQEARKANDPAGVSIIRAPVSMEER
jgi:hypothetical protein